jgi:hypothetical protein
LEWQPTTKNLTLEPLWDKLACMKSWLFRIAFILSLLATVLVGGWWVLRQPPTDILLIVFTGIDLPIGVLALILLMKPSNADEGRDKPANPKDSAPCPPVSSASRSPSAPSPWP